MRKRDFEIIFNNGFVRQILLLPEIPIKIALFFAEKEVHLIEKKDKEGLFSISLHKGFAGKHEFSDAKLIRKNFSYTENVKSIKSPKKVTTCRTFCAPEERSALSSAVSNRHSNLSDNQVTDRDDEGVDSVTTPIQTRNVRFKKKSTFEKGRCRKSSSLCKTADIQSSETDVQNQSLQKQTISVSDQTSVTKSKITTEQNMSEVQSENVNNSVNDNKDDNVEDDDYFMDVDNFSIPSSDEQDCDVVPQTELTNQENTQLSTQVEKETDPSELKLGLVSCQGNTNKSLKETSEKALDLRVIKSISELDSIDSQINTLPSLINKENSSETYCTKASQETILVQNSENDQESVLLENFEGDQQYTLQQNSENDQKSVILENFEGDQQYTLQQNFENDQESSLVQNSENQESVLVQNSENGQESVLVQNSENGQESVLMQNSENGQESVLVQNSEKGQQSILLQHSENGQESVLVENSENGQQSILLQHSENGQESVLVQNCGSEQASIIMPNSEKVQESVIMPNSENVQESNIMSNDNGVQEPTAASKIENKKNYNTQKCALCFKKRSLKRSLYRFPRCCEISRMWAFASDRPEVIRATPGERRRRYFVCSDHFGNRDYATAKLHRLKWSAIPNKKLPISLKPEPPDVSQNTSSLPDKNIIENMKSKLKLALQKPKRPWKSEESLHESPPHSACNHNNLSSSSSYKSSLQTSALSNINRVGNSVPKITLDQLLVKAASNINQNSGQQVILFEVITKTAS